MTSENITLYFKQGRSDKVYTVSLEAAEEGRFVVNFAYGRRGATLKTGTKTKKPVEYTAAKKAYDKLVKGKMAKGYLPGSEGEKYVHTDADARHTGIHCQLLNFIDEAQVADYIQDEAWWAQEKHDGRRMLIHKPADSTPADGIIAINRSGLSIGAPETILTRAGQVKRGFVVDGEAVGETLFVFDLLEVDQTDVRSESYQQRLASLESLALDGPFVIVETAKTTSEKQALYDRLHASGAEGLVFKQHAATYTAGRPNSGGTQLKFKFYATASVIVSKQNDKRSVAMAILADGARVEIGNVTIPLNKEIPPAGVVIEVRYLYAYPGGSLYQPTYIGVRDDIRTDECLISQLKYKQGANL